MAPLPTKARGRRTGSLRSYGQLRRCRWRRFGLPARLIVHFSAILCGANLKYGSLKSLSTKSRISSRRWRRCWGSSTGTPWWRPARAWGPGSRLLLVLTAVLINKMILDMYLCKFAFTSIKSDDFQLCYVIWKAEEKNSGFIAATLYIARWKRKQEKNYKLIWNFWMKLSYIMDSE